MRGDALQAFKNISRLNEKNLAEFLTVLRRQYAEPQLMATAKHNFRRLVFDPANQKLDGFLDELQKLAENVFGVAAQEILEQFIIAKLPPHLRKENERDDLEIGTYEQIVSILRGS